MNYHPAAELFPLMQGADFAELVADIAANGQLEAIWLHPDGRILDGRNRWRACCDLGIKPTFRTYAGSLDMPDLVQFVVSLNLHRRHLDGEQRREVMRQLRARGMTLQKIADAVGVSPMTVHRAVSALSFDKAEVIGADGKHYPTHYAPREVAQIAEDDEAAIEAAWKQIRKTRSDERRIERIERITEIEEQNRPLAAPVRCNVILADPPWRYEYAETENRAIENQYPTMTLAELGALPIDTVAAADCVLFLWATSPKLADALALLSAWGFNYRTCMVWVKDKIGMGYYARQRHELLLIATRGELPTPAPEDRPDSVINAPRAEHSVKPALVYELLERMYPEWPRLELFARSRRDGWHTWGNQDE